MNMEMRLGGVARTPDLADAIARGHLIALSDSDAPGGQVSQDNDDAVRLDHDMIPDRGSRGHRMVRHVVTGRDDGPGAGRDHCCPVGEKVAKLLRAQPDGGPAIRPAAHQVNGPALLRYYPVMIEEDVGALNYVPVPQRQRPRFEFHGAS